MAQKQRKESNKLVLTVCCLNELGDDHRCPKCGKPAVAVTVQVSSPEFLDAMRNGIHVEHIALVRKHLDGEWRQISPWRDISKMAHLLERQWASYQDDGHDVVVVRWLTSATLYARTRFDDCDA